jgi:5-formyltetrahydrofolate cyclo-ligase
MGGIGSERDRSAANPQAPPAVRKEELRRRLIALRRAVSAGEREGASREIARKLLDRVTWPGVGAMHIYRSVAAWSEVDTESIVATVGARYPQIEIVSPGIGRHEPLPKRQFDLIVVPVLGFDGSNNRLGLGAGFYDRFLAAQPQALKLGLAYRWALVQEGLPREPHDVPLDEIVTD